MCSNNVNAICCGFVVQLVLSKSAANPQQIEVVEFEQYLHEKFGRAWWMIDLSAASDAIGADSFRFAANRAISDSAPH